MTKMMIVVPIMGGFNESKSYWGCLLNSVKGPVDLMIIDNGFGLGSEEDKKAVPHFIDSYLEPHWPGVVTYAPQDDNIGLILSLQYAYENSTADILAYIHNDLYIYKHGWDHEVIQLFETEQLNAGLVGFFGAEGLHPNTGRFYVYSNMLEAEIHGHRANSGFMEVAVLDGMSLICSRAMLDVRNGVDTDFSIHHFYDLDLCMESLDRGFKNYALFTPIHHQSGLTACRPLFQDWLNARLGVTEQAEQLIYMKNKQRFMEKWTTRLPFQAGLGDF